MLPGLSTGASPGSDRERAPDPEPDPNPEGDTAAAQPVASATLAELRALVTFGQWQEQITGADNRPVALVTMFRALYPHHEVPAPGYAGKMAHTVAGAGRRSELLWRECARPPTGDGLAYPRPVHERRPSSRDAPRIPGAEWKEANVPYGFNKMSAEQLAQWRREHGVGAQ